MDDAERWDERYRGAFGAEQRAPEPFVVSVLDAIGIGAGRRALDLACGTGRHALLLAERGFVTEAWDVSAVGLGILEQRARARGLVVVTRRLDLSRDAPEVPHPFALVVAVDFLDRALFARVKDWLAPGGHAVFTTFTSEFGGAKRPNPAYLLEPGELGRGLSGLETRAAEESGGRASLWATKPTCG